jgi:hypothetical protein
MVSERTSSPWIPLGSAQLIDWKHLTRPASARGATAWAGRIGTDPVLLRSWSNESTTFYEFYFLSHEALSGTLVIATTRPEPTRLRLKATVDVEGRLAYTDTTELHEHPLTGLHGTSTRTFEVSAGDIDTGTISGLSAAEAEILEYAPESALLTTFGSWIHAVLESLRGHLMNGASAAAPVRSAPVAREAPEKRAPEKKAPPPIVDVEPEADFEPEMSDGGGDLDEPDLPPPPEEKPKPVTARANRETYEGPSSDNKKGTPTPKVVEPKKSKKRVLKASTNTGDNWEISDPETYIGRSKQCAIVLKSQRVSRKHATITMEDDGFYINDLGAANGIWAGTEKIDREKIEDGSEYIIGDVLVTFNLPT